MTGTPSPRRPTVPDLARLRGAVGERRTQVAIVAVLVVALSATLLAQPWAAAPPATSSPTPDSSVGPSATREPDPEAGWTGVELAPFARLADLTPSAVDGAGIGPDATFTLRSLTDAGAADLAARLEVTPSTELTVEPGSDAHTSLVRPATPLAEGTLYRFALRGEDGSLAGSWAFRVRTPVHVLSTIPGDRTTAVPVRTGIEVTFDQDGVADLADHFAIEPAVDGRFERHGRTQVFVPTALLPATAYTVTVRAGLERSGTNLVLESDVTFRFETEGPATAGAWLRFGRDVVETGLTEPPILGVEVVQLDPDAQTPAELRSADVTVYRLPTAAAASATLTTFLAAPRWTEHSQPRMTTDGLPVVSRFSAALEEVAGSPYRVLRFPETLAAGRYIVELAGSRRSQAFLQVTPVSTWVSVLTDRTVVWVNDVVGGGPLSGARVAIVGGAALGETGADGLLVAPTPASLLPPAEAGDAPVPTPPLLSVTSPAGDVVFVPFEVGWDGGIYRGEWWEKSTAADSTFWSLLYTERSLYRSTDRIETWGYLRGRDDGSVPPAVELRLVIEQYGAARDVPVIARTTVAPNPSGAFIASLPFERLPLGAYVLEAVVDGRVVARRWVEVAIIRKPAFELTLEPDRTAVVAGASVYWTATATFFDGSPVPSLDLIASGEGGERPAGPTDADGRATFEATVVADDWWGDSGTRYLHVRPSGPEEAEIYATDEVVVFPAALDLDASGRLDGDRLLLNGTVATIDLAAAEADIANGTWDGDPEGRALAGASVRAVITELIPVRRLIGTEYDFIEKVSRPRYEWSEQRREVRTLTLTSGSDGTINATVPVPDPAHQYAIVLSVVDRAGRTARHEQTVGAAVETWWFDAGVRFQTQSGADAGADSYAIGETVTWRMTDDGEPLESGGPNRYLYIVAQRGLVDTTVTSSATFDRRFAPADAPRIFIMGIRFTGATYPPKAAAWASFEPEPRRLDVAVTADRTGYRPGEEVTLTVRTTDADGQPLPARVVVQVVDEKLFAIDGATVPTPLEDLYAPVDSGIVRLTSTHQLPTLAGPEGEGGDTTGGGARIDFRDTLAFLTLDTGADGTATSTIRLSDDLTSWHVIASALTADLRAGVGERLVPVSLPLFVEATVADEYLVADRPAIRLRAFGEALRPGDPVRFTISSRTLGLAATTVEGSALETTWFELPALSVGHHTIDIAVVAPTRRDETGRVLGDRLVRSFDVIESRLAATDTTFVRAGDALPTIAGEDVARYTFTDAARGRWLPVLEGLTDPPGARLDRGLAQALARDVLVDWFGRDPATLPESSFDPSRYPAGAFDAPQGGLPTVGLALLPYGGPDPWLALRVALVAPERVNPEALGYIAGELAARDDTARDLRIAALAALAALGQPVVEDLTAALDEPDLTVAERTWLGLGFASLGDDGTARSIEQVLLAEHGQRRGAWIRLRAGTTIDETVDATALFGLLAAAVGDPLAADVVAFVVEHPSRETSHALEVAGAVMRVLERTPATAASFAWTVDGHRTVVRLAAGESRTLALTPAQRADLVVERLSGAVGIAITARTPISIADVARDPDLSLTRTVANRVLPTDELVIVDLAATFTGAALRSSCYEVEEVVPSGLVPVATGSVRAIGSYIGPSSIVGQRVTFCVPFGVAGAGPTARMRYVARVVNAGAFRWEPAILHLGSPDDGAAVAPGETIRIGD
ncbi:MAG TPA: Ig-like domain-containing protein [Candidatus Limnocylindrales bacterium]|nr:Ig-like domain-containing protein [Candidatus Limnocylindrales bacterium]